MRPPSVHDSRSCANAGRAPYLKSTLFEVKRDGGSFVFHGAGFGHGVGMCQLGAIGMADANKSHAEILAHYYRGTHLHRLY